MIKPHETVSILKKNNYKKGKINFQEKNGKELKEFKNSCIRQVWENNWNFEK